MSELIPGQSQSLIPPDSAVPTPNPVAMTAAADALGNTKTAEVSDKPLISDVGTDELVSGQLKKLLSDDSPVLQAARARTQQEAAGRGLQNSTMAGQAGEQAVINTATPIAAADASTISQRRTNNLSTVNQFGLQEQQTNNQKELIGAQTDANSKLQTEAANLELTRLREQGSINERLQTIDQNFKAVQAELDAGRALTLQNSAFQNNQTLLISEYAQKAGLSTQEANQQIATLNQQHANTLEQIKATAAAQKDAELGPKLQGQYLASVSDRMQAASAEVSAIYQTQGLTAAQQSAAVATVNARMATDLTTLQAYYAQSPLWDTEWGSGGGGATPGTAAGVAPPSLIPQYAPPVTVPDGSSVKNHGTTLDENGKPLGKAYVAYWANYDKTHGYTS